MGRGLKQDRPAIRCGEFAVLRNWYCGFLSPHIWRTYSRPEIENESSQYTDR